MNDEQRDPLPERSRVMPGAARAGILAGAGVVAVLGAVVALGAASPAPATGETGAVGPTMQEDAEATLGDPTAWGAPAGADGLIGEPGHFRGGGRFGPIEITAIDGSSLSLRTANGWTRTIAVGSDVEITKGGETIALGDLEVGDEIRLLEIRDDDGTFTIERIVVVVPTVGGTVTAVDGDSITVQGRHGLTREIATTSTTTYRLGTETTTRAEVTVGDRIHAFGVTGADDAFTASVVIVAVPKVAGEVTAVSSGSFTIQLRDGSTYTVTVDADTAYRIRGVDDPGLDDIEVGDVVAVAGTQSGSTIDAQVVLSGGAFGRGPGGFGFGFGFGHGRGGVGPGFGPGFAPDEQGSEAPSADGTGTSS